LTTLQLLDGWPAPAAPFCKGESNFDKFEGKSRKMSSDPSTGVAGRFNTHSTHSSEAFCPPFPHFDPFGTEFGEPGRVSHPDYLTVFDHSLHLQRTFQLAFQLLSPTR
jgi:hypothetical protein